MSAGSTADRLLSRVNALEGWLERQKGRPMLLPVRIGGGLLLILVLMASNIVALAAWPVSTLARALRRVESPQQSEPGARETRAPTEPVPVDADSLKGWLSSGTLVVVDFWAPWCGPCVMMSESLREFAREVAGQCVVCKVNTVQDGELAREHGVQGLPTLIVFEGGREVERHAGALGKADLRRLVAPHLPT